MSQNSKTPAVKSETRLTFGVEIEFLLAAVDPFFDHPHPKDPREVDGRKLGRQPDANIEVSRKLKAAGVPVSILWHDVDQQRDAEAFHTDWILKYDGSVATQTRIHENYREHGLEISSPPYYYDEASRKVVRTVLKTLRNNFLVRVNSSTGLHVHVGNEHDGFTLAVLRNLIAILYTYERQIRLLVPAERVTSQGKHCQPFSYSKLGQNNPDLTRLEFLNRILSYEVYNELVFNMSPMLDTERLAFNIMYLSLPYSSFKRTIEFRLHPGSLDHEAVFHWIHFCIKLVEKATQTSKQDELIDQLKRDVEKPIGLDEGGFSTIDLLMWLGCPAQAYYYGADMVADPQKLQERIEEDARLELLATVLARESLIKRQSIPGVDLDDPSNYDFTGAEKGGNKIPWGPYYEGEDVEDESGNDQENDQEEDKPGDDEPGNGV